MRVRKLSFISNVLSVFVMKELTFVETFQYMPGPMLSAFRIQYLISVFRIVLWSIHLSSLSWSVVDSDGLIWKLACSTIIHYISCTKHIDTHVHLCARQFPPPRLHTPFFPHHKATTALCTYYCRSSFSLCCDYLHIFLSF